MKNMKLDRLNIDDLRFNVVKNGEFYCCGFIHQRKKGLLSFIASRKYLLKLENSSVSCIICPESLVEEVRKIKSNIGIISCENPRALLLKINNLFMPKKFKTVISSSAKISSKAIISDYNVYIGENVIIDDNVIIKPNTIIRDNVVVGASSIISSDGFMLYELDDNLCIAEHKGYVYIDKDTKLLCNILIEKAVFYGETTYIGKNVIMDSGVSISHGVYIGNKVTLAANTKICGYTKIGNKCYLGPMSVVSNNLTIGNNCNIRIGSVVVNNLKDNADVSGPFSIDHKMNLLNQYRKIK